MLFDDEPEDVKFLNVVNRNPRRSASVQMQGRPILDFDPDNETSFKIWKRKWESWIYMIRQEEGFLDLEKRFHLLMSCLSDATMSHVFDLGLSGADERNPSRIIEGLAGLLSEGKNHHLFRYEFGSRVQQPYESLDSWMASLKSLIKFTKFDCDCCTKCPDSRLLQQLVFGVNSPEVRQLLIDIGPGLTLDQAIRIIQRSEVEQLAQPATFNQTSGEPSTLPGNSGHQVAIVDLSGEQTDRFEPGAESSSLSHLESRAASHQRVQPVAPNASGTKTRLGTSGESEPLSNPRSTAKPEQKKVSGGNKENEIPEICSSSSKSPRNPASKNLKERSIKNWIEFIKHSKSAQQAVAADNASGATPPTGQNAPRRSRSADACQEPKKPRALSPALPHDQPDISTTKISQASFYGPSRSKNSPQTPKHRDQDQTGVQVDIRGMLQRKPEVKKASAAKASRIDSKLAAQKVTPVTLDSNLSSRAPQSQNPGRNGSSTGIKTGTKRKAKDDSSIEVVSAHKRPQARAGTRSPVTDAPVGPGHTAPGSGTGSIKPGSNRASGVRTSYRSNAVTDTILKIISRKRRPDVTSDKKTSGTNESGKSSSIESKAFDATKKNSKPEEAAQGSTEGKIATSKADAAAVEASQPEMTMSLSIKPDPGVHPCQICKKTFESFSARGDHQCSSNQSEASAVCYCSICEARLLVENLDGNGRCRQCQGL